MSHTVIQTLKGLGIVLGFLSVAVLTVIGMHKLDEKYELTEGTSAGITMFGLLILMAAYGIGRVLP